MISRLFTSSLLLVLLITVAGGAPASGEVDSARGMDLFRGDRVTYLPLDITLTGALFHGDTVPEADERKDVVLYLGYAGDTAENKDDASPWRAHFIAWSGMRRDDGPEDDKARRFSSMDQEGTVTQASREGDRHTLYVTLDVHPDPWVPGGEARYTVELTREGDRFTGTYSGTFRDQAISGEAGGTLAEEPWPAAVEGWQPLEIGEHPRLMFRKADLPALRKRAATPTGQAIVARMKGLLGGGEALPADRDFTLGHGVGFGMLYQLTGEQKYADLARQCTQLALDGRADKDKRYSFQNPGGKLRGGPSTAQVALAYDLCYDAWPEDFRQTVARAIQEKLWNPTAPKGPLDQKEPTGGDLIFNTGGGQHSPHSNHYGAWNGGAGVATLAIMGDPGTDDAILQRVHRVLLQRAQRALEVGYGDSGWFFEGHHGGRLNFNTGLAEYLAALRTAAGLELVRGFEGGDYLTTKWLYELTRQEGGGGGGKLRDVHRGIYAGHGFTQGAWSGSGDFALGFAHTPDAWKPAVLWFYQHVVQPGEAGTTSFDSLHLPSRAAWALIHWPIDAEPVNPGESLPEYLVDPKADYYVLRSGWSDDGNDWVLAVKDGNAMLRGPNIEKDNIAIAQLGQVRRVVPLGEGDDAGQAVMIESRQHRILADTTGVSGAPIVVLIGPPATTGDSEPDADAAPPAEDDSPEALLKRRFGSGGSSTATRPAPAARTPGPDAELLREEPRAADRTLRVGTEDWRVITLQAGPAPKLEPIDIDGRPAIQIGNRVITLGQGDPELSIVRQ